MKQLNVLAQLLCKLQLIQQLPFSCRGFTVVATGTQGFSLVFEFLRTYFLNTV